MKSAFLFFVLSLMSLPLTAQVTFEHSYSNVGGRSGTDSFFHTSTGLYYYTLSSTTSSNVSINTYDENHVFQENIPVNGEILFITDKLVNNDDNIEIFVRRTRYVMPDNYVTKDIFIIDHLGNVLYSFYDRYYAHLVQNSNNDIKLIVDGIGNCPGCTYSYNYVYDVYGLSGILSTGQEEYLEKRMIGFPIPTENTLTLYNIPVDGQKNIEIFDSAGRKVLQSTVSGRNGEATVDVSSLEAGAYICRYGKESVRFTKK